MSETVVEDVLALGKSGGDSEIGGGSESCGDKTLADAATVAATVGVNKKTDVKAKSNTGNKADANKTASNKADANTKTGDDKKTDRAQVGRNQRGKHKRGARYNNRGRGARRGYRRGGRSKNFRKTSKDYSLDGLKSFVASIPEETKNALVLFNTYLEVDNAHRRHEKEIEKAELAKKSAAKRLRDLNARQANARQALDQSDDKKSSGNKPSNKESFADKKSFAGKQSFDKKATNKKPYSNKKPSGEPSAQEISDAETAYREAVEALNKAMSNKVPNISDQVQTGSAGSDMPSTL